MNKESNIFKNIISVLLTLLILGLAAGTASAYTSPAPVDLGIAGNFAILAETGITNTGSHASVITGNIGNSPGTAAQMNNVFCSEITGTIYGVDAAYVGSGDIICFAGNPPLANKDLVDNAVFDMVTAYTNAAGRTLPDATELGAGDISTMTIAPGLYKWGTGVQIDNRGVTLSGGPNDVWIFQIAQGLAVDNAAIVTLSGGAQAKNIFWQVGTQATLGTTSVFNGNILAGTAIVLQTGAILNGRALAQSAVTLDSNVVNGSTPTPTPKGSISGMKFNDLNGNGIKDIGEPGLANWTITLTNQSGNTVNTVTDANGNYSFTNLPDGNYTVGEILKPGWIQTAPAVSTTGSATYTVNISGGNQVVGQDFGNFNGTVLPKPCRDFVTGGGWIDVKGHKDDKNDKATFGVSGGIKHEKFWGQLSYNDHDGMKVKSTKVTNYTIIDSVTRQIEGIARVNGKGSFNYTVVVVDNGEPGRNDSFSLELSNGYSASGTLKGGNIQIHKECRKPHDDDDKEKHDDKDERDGHKNCDNDRD